MSSKVTSKKVSDAGSAVYHLFMLGLSIYVLVVLVLESFVIEDLEIQKVLQIIDLVICLVFLTDFCVNLAIAKDRLAFLKWGWIDLVSSIPAIDPLRWGRLSRVVRIVRFLRSIKSVRLLTSALHQSKLQSLTLIVLFAVFLAYTLSAALVLEFERGYDSQIGTAQEALSWAAMNLFNAKVSIDEAQSTGGRFVTVLLNKSGLLLFAYLNALLVAWLLQRRAERKNVS